MYKRDKYNQVIFAAQYWHSAKIIIDKLPPQTEPYIPLIFVPILNLLCISCELTLKHYLMEKGVTEKQLKSKEIRHDLPGLLNLAGQHGIILRTNDLEIVTRMSNAYKNHMLRYGFVGNTIMFTLPSDMLNATARIIDVCSGDPAFLRETNELDTSSLEWPIDWEHPILEHLKPTG